MQPAETISFALTQDMLRAISESVESGEFASTGEAVRDAPRVWRRERLEQAQRLDSIRARIRRSLDDPRPSSSFEEVEARLAKLHEETVKAHGDAAAQGSVSFRSVGRYGRDLPLSCRPC